MEPQRRLDGVIPVLPVPFAEDQSLDRNAFIEEIRWVVARQVDGLALFGLASEYWKLSDAERLLLTEWLTETVGGRKLVVVSVTDSCRFHAERFARQAAALGADALIVMPPHFMSPGVEKVIDHCRAVADAIAPLPVVVQYSPAYIGVSLAAEAFVRMQEQSPNIGYIKVEPRPPGPLIEKILAASNGRIECLIGQGGLTLADCRRRGIAGVMPGVSVVEIYRTLWDGLVADPIRDETWDLNDRMVAMMSHIVPTIDLWVAAEKHVLAWRGVGVSTVLRDPSSPPEDGFLASLRTTYERLRPYLENEEPSWTSPAEGRA